MADNVQWLMYRNPGMSATEAQAVIDKAEEERKKKEAEERAKANLKANQEKAKQYTAEAQAKKNEGNAVQRLAKSLFGFTPEEEAQYQERATLFAKTKQLAESKTYVPPNKRTDFTSAYDINQQQPIDATKKYEYGKHYTSKELREGLLNKELYYANDSFYRVFTDNDGNQQTESVPFLKLQRNGILAVPRYNIIDKEYGEGLPISFVSEKATETEQEFQKLAREKTMEQIDKSLKTILAVKGEDRSDLKTTPIYDKNGKPIKYDFSKMKPAEDITFQTSKDRTSSIKEGFLSNPILGAATGRYDYKSEQTGKKLDLKGAYGLGQTMQTVSTGIAGAFTGAAVANVAKLGVGATAVATGIAGAAPMQPTYLDQLRKGAITKGQYGAYTLADVGSMTVGSYIGQKFNAAKFMGEAIDAAKKGERVMPLVFKNYFKEVGVSTLAETPFNIASSAASAATAPQEDFNKAFLINMGLQTGMSLSMEGVVDLLGARGNVKSYKYLQDGVNSGRWKNADDMANDIFTRFDVKNKKTQEKIKNYATDIYRGKTVLETPEQKGITAMVQGDLGMPKAEEPVQQAPPSPEQQVEALKQTEGDMIAAIEGIKEKEQMPDKDIRAKNKNLGIDNDDPATSATINKGAFDAYSKLTGEELDINNPEHYKTVQQVKNDVLNGQSTLKPKHLYDPDTESYQNLMVKQGANTVGNEAENVRNHLLRINEIQEVLDDVVRINETANNMDRATTLANISHNAGGKADIDPWNVILEKTYPSRRLAMGEVEVDATLENVHKWMLANSMPNEKLMGDVPMTKSEIDKYANNIIDKSGHRPQSNLMFGDSEIQNVRRPTPQELEASTNKIRLLQDEYKASKNQISLASKKATPEELSVITSKMKGLQNSIATAEKELNKGSVDLAKVNEIQADIKAKAGDVLRELDAQSKPTKEGAKPQIRREVAKAMATAVSDMRKKMDSYANALKEMDNLERGLSKGVKEAKPTEAVNQKPKVKLTNYFKKSEDAIPIFSIDKEKLKLEKPNAYEYLSEFRLPKDITANDTKKVWGSAYMEMPRFKEGAEKHLKILSDLEDIHEGMLVGGSTKEQFKMQAKMSGDFTQKQLDIFNVLVDSLQTESMPAYISNKKVLQSIDKNMKSDNFYALSYNIMSSKSPESFVHEIGHFAFFNILSKQDRLDFWQYMIDSTYDKGTKSLADRLAITSEPIRQEENGMTYLYRTNAADNFNEYFAEQFRQWYLKEKVAPKEIDTIFAKVADFLHRVIAKLKSGDYIDKNLIKFFDKIISKQEAKPTEAVNPFTGDVTKDVTRMELVNKEIESAAQKYDNDILEYSASVNTFGVTPAEYIDIKTNPDPRGSQQLQNAEYAVQEAMRNAEEGSDISMAQMDADDAAIREVEILAHDPDDINTTELMKQQAGVPSVMTYGKVPEGIDPNHILGNPKYNEVAKEFIGGALIAAGFMNGDDNEGATPVFSAALLIGGMPMTARYHTLRDALMKRVGGVFAPKTMWGQTLLGNPYNISDNDLVANIRNSPAYAALRPGVAGEKFVNEIKDISKRQDGIIGNFLNGKWMTWEMMDKRAEKTAPNMDEFYKEQTGMGKAASISALLRAKIKPKSVLNDHKRVLQDMEKQLQKIKSPIKTKIDDIEALGLGSATFTDIHQQANDFENQTKFLPKDQRYQFVQRESSTDKNVVKAINDFTNLNDQLLYREGEPLSRKTKSDWVKKIDNAWENYKTQKLLSLQTQDNFKRTVDLLQGKYGKDFTPEEIATYSDKYYAPMKKYFERTERREWDARAIQKTGKTIDELRSEMPDRELAFNQFTAKEAELKAEVQKYANQITYRNKQIGALEYLAKDTRTLPDQKTKYINTISALKDSKKEIQKKVKEISNEYKTLRGGPEYRLAKETLLNAKNLVQQSDVAVRRGYMNTKLMSEYGKRYHINVSEIDPQTGQMIHYANSNVRTAGFSTSIHQTKKDLDKYLTERNGTPVAQDQVFGNNSSPRPLWFMTEIDVVDRYGKKVIDENGNPKRTMVKVEVKDRYAFSPVFNQTKEQLTQLVGVVLGKNGVSSSTNPSVVKLNKDAFDNQVRALRSSIDELRSASDDTDIDGMNDQVETMNKVLSSLEGVYGNKPTEATGRDVVRLLSMLRNPDPFLIPTKNYDFYSLGEGAKYGKSLKEFWEGTQGDHVARAKTALNKAEAGNIFLQAAEELNKQHQLGINNRMTAYLQGIIERGDSYINKVSKHDIIRTGQIKSLSGERIWDVKKTIQNATALEAFRLLGFNLSSGIKNIVGSTSGSTMASGLMAGTYKQAMAEPWKSAAGGNILSALKNGQFLRNLSPDQVATIEKNALAIQDITERAKLLAIIKSYKGGLFNNDIDLGAFENKGILGRAITKGRDASMYVMGATEFFNNVGAGTRAIDDYANKYPYDATKHGEVEDYIDWLAQVGYTQAGFVNGKYGDNDVPPILRPLLNSWIGRPLTLMMKPALQQYSLGAQLVTDYFFRAKNSPNKNTALRYVPLVALASASIPVMMLQGDDGMPVISDILNLTNTLLNKINQEEDGPKAVQEKIRIGKALDDLVYAGMDNAHNKFGVDVDNMKRFWQTMHKGMLSAITEQAGFGVDMSMPSNVDDFFTPVLANEVKTFYTDLGKSYFEADNVWDALSQAGIKHIVPTFAKNIIKTAKGMEDGKYYTGLIEQSSMDVQWTWAHAILGMPLQAREAVTNQYEMINPLTVPEQKANYIKTVINNNSQDAVFLDFAETGQNRQQDKAYAIKQTAKYAPEIKEKLLTEFQKPKIQEAIERDCKKLEEYLTKKRKGSSYVSRLEEYTRRDIETNSELITSNNKNNDASEKELRQYVGQYYYSLVLNKLINDNPKTYGKYITSQLNSDYGRKNPGYEFAVSKWRKAVGVDEDY